VPGPSLRRQHWPKLNPYSTILGLNKLLFVIVAVIAIKALKQLVVGALSELKLLHLRGVSIVSHDALSGGNMKFKLFSRLLLSVSTLLTLAPSQPLLRLRDAL